MFERRLRFLLVLFGAAALVLLARLLQLQVVQGEVYRQHVQDLLRGTRESLPFVRGGIFDRQGRPLVTDAPCWQIAVDYRVLSYDASRLRSCTTAYGLKRRYAALAPGVDPGAAFAAELDEMWRRLAEFGEADPAELRGRRDQIIARVRRIRELVAARAGYDDEVVEERSAHAVIRELGAERHVEARTLFQRYPWVHIQPATVRRYHDAEPLAHILGRLGPVDAGDLERDPQADDRFARYLPDERIGQLGAEKLLDASLRGRRGELVRDRNGDTVPEEYLPAENGEDARLTLRADLQQRLYDLFARIVPTYPDVSGGCAVVLSVDTRDVLACVSYPSYDPAMFQENFTQLRDDTARLPLVFRAGATQYAPGSIVKPLIGIAALAEGKLGLGATEHCAGYLFPETPDAPASKCWEIEGTGQRMHHGDVDVVAALRGSCNLFMYKVGERLGVREITAWFDRVGIGRPTGVGLAEEVSGINPTPAYLASRGLPLTSGYARAYAIGQGEISVTPLQAANLIACYAGGSFRPLRLKLGAPLAEAAPLPGSPAQWRAIREGMYEVVNHPSGTAHKYVSFADDGYVLCGKTGSATAPARPTLYAVPAEDEAGAADVFYVPAGSRADALQRFELAHPGWTAKTDEMAVVSTWPADPPPLPKRLSHAWFGGFLQPRGAGGEPDWSRAPRIAFAVLVEFGGSGGRVSGPVAAELSRVLLDTLGPDLDPDGAPPDAP
ncbi:MAG: hypothetical protein IT449_16775 [Phycisphaerales bacterium]|nr:hypothetical protein [Phycisphaerales bacterium]